jgi:hypothetical protein
MVNEAPENGWILEGIIGNMEGEVKILLKILKGGDVQEISVDQFDADKLIRLAEMHRVNYQLYVFAQSHPKILTASQVEMLSHRCRKNALRSLEQLQELIRITGDLEKAGIPVVVIKGPQLARMVHGREALKESVDLDILLVHDSDLGQAHLLLTAAGYTQSNLNAHPGKLSRKIFLIAKREVHYFNPRNKSHIDLHVRAGANTYLTDGLFKDVFKELESFDLDGHPVTVFAREQYLVYLCYHGALHQFSRLGWLMDIRAFVVAFRDVLDYEKTISLARNNKSETCLFLAFALLENYFGDEVPVVLKQVMPGDKRFRFLVNSCSEMLSKEPGYGLTLPGRTNKLSYMMRLISTLRGRADLLYGISMRYVSKFFV